MVLNWGKIVGNTIVVFCTAAVAINLAGAPIEIIAAFYAAAITAMLALGKELQDESNEIQDLKASPLLLL